VALTSGLTGTDEAAIPKNTCYDNRIRKLL